VLVDVLLCLSFSRVTVAFFGALILVACWVVVVLFGGGGGGGGGGVCLFAVCSSLDDMY
jgi:hypothetical protein